MIEPSLAGFRYDFGRAEAIAGALGPVLAEAAEFGATPADRLAALGVAAARVIVGAGFERVPELVTQSLANLITDVVKRARETGELGARPRRLG